MLTDLNHQVRPAELRWLAAAAPFRSSGAEDELLATLRLLGALVLDGFPGTPLPNAMVDVLRSLAVGAGRDLPWTEELAADIWAGTSFAAAARQAATTLAGTPYGHYYELPPRPGSLSAPRSSRPCASLGRTAPPGGGLGRGSAATSPATPR